MPTSLPYRNLTKSLVIASQHFLSSVQFKNSYREHYKCTTQMSHMRLLHIQHTHNSKLIIFIPLYVQYGVLHVFFPLNTQVILRTDKSVNSYSDRSILKNLGRWLGMQTLAKNKPVFHEVCYPLLTSDHITYVLKEPCVFFIK